MSRCSIGNMRSLVRFLVKMGHGAQEATRPSRPVRRKDASQKEPSGECAHTVYTHLQIDSLKIFPLSPLSFFGAPASVIRRIKSNLLHYYYRASNPTDFTEYFVTGPRRAGFRRTNIQKYKGKQLI